MKGWYYLHINEELIFKRDLEGMEADFRESDFVRQFWSFDSEDRMTAWTIVVEALALGANPKRVMELAVKWGCNDADAEEYAKRIGVVFERDGNAWHAHDKNYTNPMESKEGFGETKLEALAEFAKDLGLKAQKTWGATFLDLVGKA